MRIEYFYSAIDEYMLMITVNPVCTSRKQQYQFYVKMTDSMKFGPEWLRNLSSEGTTGSSSVPRNTQYTLADHRYGREEMLALFEQSLKLRPPASISSFKSLYVDQALNPLALAPVTDDENRMWARPAIVGAPRGRGGSMDRGRGRGRGNTFHPGFTRSTSSYDEPVRPWGERNGEVADWSGERSPRKDFAGGRMSQENWRRQRADEADPDGWRTANHRAPEIKWGPAMTRTISCSWRDFGDQRSDEHSHLTDRQANSRIPRHSGGDAPTRNASQRRMFDNEDHLPEWATENPSETGGTFDASGAFHGSDDEFPPGEKGSHRPHPHTNNCAGNALQKSASQQCILPAKKPSPLSTSQSATNLIKKLDEAAPKEKKDSASPSATPDTKSKLDEINHKNRGDSKKTTSTIIQSANILVNNSNNTNSILASAATLQQLQQQQHKSIDKSRENTSATTKVEMSTKKFNQSASSKVDNHHLHTNRKVDDEFDHMKEVTDDIVAKLILDDELPKGDGPTQHRGGPSVQGGAPIHSLPYPAGLAKALGAATTTPSMAPSQVSGISQDKWYYRDPQGETQGPFSSQEMADWFGAGYFTLQLMVRRQCDDQYFTLGDLVKQCPGSIPFLSCRLPPLKNDPVTVPHAGAGPSVGGISEPIQMQLQMQRMLQRHADYVRTMTEPWSGQPVPLPHMTQPPPQSHPDLSYLPAPLQSGPPLMHMLGQMQQAGKLPMTMDKPSHQPMELDSLQQLVQQMGGMTPSSIGGPPPPHGASVSTVPPPVVMPGDVTSTSTPKEDPIQSLLRQLAANQPQQQQQQQRDYWEMHGGGAQFSRGPPPMNTAPPQQPQWMGGNTSVPTHTMWDLHTSQPIQQQSPIMMPMNHQQIPMPPSAGNKQMLPEPIDKEEQKKKSELEKEQKLQQKERKEASEREKKKKEQQEQLEKAKATQKEVEEKRKEEQRKLESEKRAQAEKQKKDEERIRKEIEKAKREAEEKRLRELEEKRRLKEQRKADEEARKKSEEDRKREEDEERLKKEQEKREEQSRRQADALRKMQEQQLRTKVAPWCQTTTATNTSAPTGLSLAEIQKAEREKRAAETALLAQQQKAQAAAKEAQEQQTSAEKANMHLKWATKKPTIPKKIKSLAEIQAEEQERITKQTAEARLAQQKEKESSPAATTYSSHTSIWSSASQTLSWNTNNHSSGFWDDTPMAPAPKPQKQLAAVNNNKLMLQQPQITANSNGNKVNKSRAKKEEQTVMKIFDKNSASSDEFTAWCMKTLASLTSDVDIPTFVGFLRDIESPYEVKDYVRQYLGDNPPSLHFANQFVEKRSRVKEMQRLALQHKDDLCQPAPAINPSTEFQEVKGKSKKAKKSKMTKVDARILGFSVTAAENRINVGDRDYGDI